VETWRVFGQSEDKFGKRNSINETQEGEATPYEDINVGTTAGSLDLAYALETSISEALDIVDNVLGVASLGITTDLIAQFAISQLKLQNAQIIDAVRIVDAAVKTAKIDALAVTEALIQNFAVTSIKVGDGEIYAVNIHDGTITNAKIDEIYVNSITNWEGETIVVGSGVTFQGPVYITGGSLSCSFALNATLGIDIGPTASYKCNGSAVINSLKQFVGSGGIATSGNINISSSGKFQIGGTDVIDQTRSVFGTDVHASGVFKVSGTKVVSARQAAVADASASHSVASWGDVEAALDALGGTINAIINRMESHGLIAA